nr:MAG TPA: Dna polymerase B [Caudoviricetes sp.]
MSEVIRVEKNRNYTVMSNCHLADRRLSLKAIGLLSKILSLPDGWDYTIAGLVHICNEGKAAIATAIRELETAGYVERRQLRTKDGAFGGNEYIVHEEPISKDAPLTDFRLTDNRLTENPSTENRPQLNTNIPSTNIPPIVPLGEKPAKGRRREAKKEPDWKPDRFADFWQAYPRGESKQAAINAWDKLKPDDDLLEAMARGLMRQLRSEQWQAGIGIPYASTWINQRRWEDEDKGSIRPADDHGGLRQWH